MTTKNKSIEFRQVCPVCFKAKMAMHFIGSWPICHACRDGGKREAPDIDATGFKVTKLPAANAMGADEKDFRRMTSIGRQIEHGINLRGVRL